MTDRWLSLSAAETLILFARVGAATGRNLNSTRLVAAPARALRCLQGNCRQVLGGLRRLRCEKRETARHRLAPTPQRRSRNECQGADAVQPATTRAQQFGGLGQARLQNKLVESRKIFKWRRFARSGRHQNRGWSSGKQVRPSDLQVAGRG